MGLRVLNPVGAISPNKVVKNKKLKTEKIINQGKPVNMMGRGGGVRNRY